MKLSDRSLGGLLVVAWLCLLMIEPLSHKYDDMTSPQPWFKADLELYHDDEKGTQVRYRRIINRPLRGDPWYGWMEYQDQNGQWMKYCSGSGKDTYAPNQSGTLSMTIAYFTGSRVACIPESNIIRVCAAWHMIDNKGRDKNFGPECSLSYDLDAVETE